MNPIGGRPVQQVSPEPERRQPVRPPAQRTPEMSVPDPDAKPAARASKTQPVRQAPEEARGRTPTTGGQVRPGTAIAETGATGFGTGLSTGGGGSGGAGYLDVGNFCCPEYLQTMVQRIYAHWESQQGVAADALVKFTIQRDGGITNVELERTSGYPMLDLSAQRALLQTRQLPPLPAAFTEPSLTVHLYFRYHP
jgi:protein TonB